VSEWNNIINESLNSDYQHLHQYQQPLSSNKWIQKRQRHMALEIQVMACSRHKIFSVRKTCLPVDC